MSRHQRSVTTAWWSGAWLIILPMTCHTSYSKGFGTKAWATSQLDMQDWDWPDNTFFYRGPTARMLDWQRHSMCSLVQTRSRVPTTIKHEQRLESDTCYHLFLLCFARASFQETLLHKKPFSCRLRKPRNIDGTQTAARHKTRHHLPLTTASILCMSHCGWPFSQRHTCTKERNTAWWHHTININ